MRFDLDPTPQRVLTIAVLEFLAALLGGIYLILQTGQMPSNFQLLTVFIVALLQLVLFLLAFVKGEELNYEEELKKQRENLKNEEGKQITW